MPKKVDHAQRRQEIADATLEAIASRGLDEVRMVDIARATEATTGQLVHYFPDKDAMLAAALDAIMARLIAHLAEPPAAGQSFIDAIAEALPIDAESRGEWRVWLQFTGRAMFNASFGPKHEHYYEQITDSIAAGLRDAIPPAKAAALADAVVAAIDGIGVRACLEPKAWPATRQKKLLAQMLRPMLAEAGIDESRILASWRR